MTLFSLRRRQLSHYSASEHGRTLIGCFCAASNVTGILNDDLAITVLLHKFGALAFWDYATAAPYVNIDMNPKIPEDMDRLAEKVNIFSNYWDLQFFTSFFLWAVRYLF